MARDRRRRGRGSARVLALVGAAFVLYCVLLARLHVWTQQADGASHQVGPGAGLGGLDPPGRVLERQLDNPRAAGNLRDGAGGAGDAKREEPRAAERPRGEATTAAATEKAEPTIPARPPMATAAAGPVATTATVATTSTATVATTSTAAVTTTSAAAVTTTSAATTTAAAAAAAVLDRVPSLETAPAKTEVSDAMAPAAKRQPHADARVEANAPQLQVENQLQQQPKQLVDANSTLGAEQLDVVPPATETTAPPTVESHVPFRDRHQVIAGYEKLMAFLENYMASPEETLFLFFVCSDKHFHPDDWSPMCTTAKQHVYSVFANSPSRNRLVTVLAGSERYWKFANAFYDDPDIRLKGVPCIMKWEGHRGRTTGMMFDESLQYDVFLRYLFGNVDKPDPFLTPANIEGKQIITVNGYEAYQQKMAEFKREQHPVATFMIMVSGRFKANNRPWCPYCRYSELPIEYAFYAYAPPRSRLLRVEVTNSYNAWKRPNQFNRDKELDMHVVPALYRLQITPPVSSYALALSGSNNVGSINYERHKIRLDLLPSLREVFARRAT